MDVRGPDVVVPVGGRLRIVMAVLMLLELDFVPAIGQPDAGLECMRLGNLLP